MSEDSHESTRPYGDNDESAKTNATPTYHHQECDEDGDDHGSFTSTESSTPYSPRHQMHESRHVMVQTTSDVNAEMTHPSCLMVEEAQDEEMEDRSHASYLSCVLRDR